MLFISILFFGFVEFMLFDVESFAPQMIHIVHHGIENGEKAEEEICPEQGWEMERKIELIGKGDGKLFRLFKVGNVAENNHAFTDKSSRI